MRSFFVRCDLLPALVLLAVDKIHGYSPLYIKRAGPPRSQPFLTFKWAYSGHLQQFPALIQTLQSLFRSQADWVQ